MIMTLLYIAVSVVIGITLVLLLAIKLGEKSDDSLPYEDDDYGTGFDLTDDE